jgi:hypothetical protein
LIKARANHCQSFWSFAAIVNLKKTKDQAAELPVILTSLGDVEELKPTEPTRRVTDAVVEVRLRTTNAPTEGVMPCESCG